MPVPARAIAERRIAELFLSQDAVRPESAIAYEPDRFVRARAFERLQEQGIVHSAPNNRWYLDAPLWVERYRGRRQRAVTVLVGAIIAGAIASLL